jgi:hypothetical protein
VHVWMVHGCGVDGARVDGVDGVLDGVWMVGVDACGMCGLYECGLDCACIVIAQACE